MGLGMRIWDNTELRSNVVDSQSRRSRGRETTIFDCNLVSVVTLTSCIV